MMSILKKVETLPDWVKELFTAIDHKKFEKLPQYFSSEFVLHFSHYTLKGVEKAIHFVGTFDKGLPGYEHIMEEVWVSDELIMFGGTLKVTLEDGTSISTPFWNRFYIEEGKEQFKKAYAMFSIAAFPERFWRGLTL